MKNKFMNKRTLAVVSVLLVLLVTVGGTLAYIFMSTNPVTNTFTPGKVETTVVETFKDNVKSNVQIKNTGNTDAYIRVALVVSWKSTGGSVYAQSPTLGVDYSLTLDLANGWTKGSDGYYYYNAAVAPKGLTNALISEAKQLKDGPVGADDTQYYLSVEIVASGIQATGMGVDSVTDAWANVQPSGN